MMAMAPALWLVQNDSAVWPLAHHYWGGMGVGKRGSSDICLSFQTPWSNQSFMSCDSDIFARVFLTLRAVRRELGLWAQHSVISFPICLKHCERRCQFKKFNFKNRIIWNMYCIPKHTHDYSIIQYCTNYFWYYQKVNNIRKSSRLRLFDWPCILGTITNKSPALTICPISMTCN